MQRSEPGQSAGRSGEGDSGLIQGKGWGQGGVRERGTWSRPHSFRRAAEAVRGPHRSLVRHSRTRRRQPRRGKSPARGPGGRSSGSAGKGRLRIRNRGPSRSRPIRPAPAARTGGDRVKRTRDTSLRAYPPYRRRRRASRIRDSRYGVFQDSGEGRGEGACNLCTERHKSSCRSLRTGGLFHGREFALQRTRREGSMPACRRLERPPLAQALCRSNRLLR